jgi:hypothetical protein
MTLEDVPAVSGDRAGLLLNLLHYANYRFFFFAKITFQFSL